MAPTKVHKPPAKLVAGRYEINSRLGAGCFGEVWRGHDATTNQTVAVKFEDKSSKSLQLDLEVEILQLLARPKPQEGFAEIYHSGQEGRFRCLVMERLGSSLEDHLQASASGRIVVPSVLLIAEQVLRRIEFLHSKGIVHRDIKPENFMFGLKEKIHHLYMIDFGLCKRYYGDRHALMKKKLSLTGTARYASINAHKGVEQSRRDDLEAIGHMLMYFLRGSLPWSGLSAKTQAEKYKKIQEKKESTPLQELCQGFPDAFQTYLKTVRNLEFSARPDYHALRKLLRDEREQRGPAEDHGFAWLAGKDLGQLVPLKPWEGVKQPDDRPQTKRWSFCPCGGQLIVRVGFGC